MSMPQMYKSKRWQNLRVGVLERDGWVCCVCGVVMVPGVARGWEPRTASVDHIVPVAWGGAQWDPNNLRSMCLEHNLAMGMHVRKHGQGYMPRREW